MSDILFSFSGIGLQEVNEALYRGRLDATLLKLLGQIQISGYILVSTNQISCPSPKRGLQDDVIVRVAAKPEVTAHGYQADDGRGAGHEGINLLRGDLPYLHEPRTQQDLLQFIQQR